MDGGGHLILTNKIHLGKGKRREGGTFALKIRNALLIYGFLGERNKRKRGGKIRKRVFETLPRLAGSRAPACLWGELGNRSSPPPGAVSISLSLL